MQSTALAFRSMTKMKALGPVPSANTSTTPLVEIDGVSKTYEGRDGGKFLALKDVSVSVKRNEFICIVGQSGCGKSTLLRMLAGLLPVSEGMIVVDGMKVVGPRRDMGVVFQSPVLLPWLNIASNVRLPAILRRLPKQQQTGGKVEELLNLVRLDGFGQKYPFELSGGMQQRVGIARSLICDPTVLLMDEPFGALDSMTRESLNLELQRICMEKQTTVFLITHGISEAVFLADRVLVMSPRPGTLVDDITIDLPRPRSLDVIQSEKFGQYVRAIRRHFAHEES